VTPHKPRSAAPTLRVAEAAGKTSDVVVEQKQLGKLAGGDGLPDGRVPDVPLPDIPLPDVPLPGVPVPKARPDGLVGEE
jgi:hypothetical protein